LQASNLCIQSNYLYQKHRKAGQNKNCSAFFVFLRHRSDSEGSYQRIKARMPLAELDKYSTGLRSMTQARATFNSEFLEYAPVPPNVQSELIEAYKKISTDEE